MKIGKRHIWTLILCCYFAAVLLLLTARPEHMPEFQWLLWGIPADKIGHFLIFIPYPVIAYTAFRPADGGKLRRLMVLVAVLATGIALAMGTERLQGLIEYRSYEVEDFYADVLGMEVSGIIAALYIICKKEKKQNNR